NGFTARKGHTMGKLGAGYGSEWQLTRFLGRHRNAWDQAIRELLASDGTPGLVRIDWLDFPFSPHTETYDQERKGLDFLIEEHKDKWIRWKKDFWPDHQSPRIDRTGIHTWDAIGRLHFAQSSRPEWLLVEAKAHKEEFTTSPTC